MSSPRVKKARLNLYDVLVLRKDLERLQHAVDELRPWTMLPVLTLEVENDVVISEILLSEALGSLSEMMNTPLALVAATLHGSEIGQKFAHLDVVYATMKSHVNELYKLLNIPYIKNMNITNEVDDMEATHAVFVDCLTTTLEDPMIAQFHSLCQEFQICTEDAETKAQQMQKLITAIEPKLLDFQKPATLVLRHWVVSAGRAAKAAEDIMERVSLTTQGISALDDAASCMTRMTAADTQLECCICKESTGNAQGCTNERCDHSVCSSCFDNLIMNADSLSKQREVVNRVCIRNGCTGTYPQHIVTRVCGQAQDRYVELKANTMMNERIRESFVEEQRELLELGQMTYGDRLFRQGMKILTRLCGTYCPSCFASFADFQACCALSCANCPTKFCALCLQQTPGENAHAHVSNCPERRHFTMTDNLFIRREDWIAGRANISNRLLDEHLMTLPSNLTMSTGANVVDELRRTFRKNPTDLPPVTTTDREQFPPVALPLVNDALRDEEEVSSSEEDETIDTSSSSSEG